MSLDDRTTMLQEITEDLTAATFDFFNSMTALYKCVKKGNHPHVLLLNALKRDSAKIKELCEELTK